MKNKYFMIGLIALIIISLLIVIENYRYLSLNKKNYIYYETSCKNNNQESCSYINSFPYYEMDANSFFISCMNTKTFNSIIFFIPLIITIMSILYFFEKIKKGYIKYELIRGKSIYIQLFCLYKYAFILPLFFLFIYILSCIVTKFNFNIESLKYYVINYNFNKVILDNIINYYFVYFFVLFLVNIFFINIGLIIARFSSNIISIVLKMYIIYMCIFAFFEQYLEKIFKNVNPMVFNITNIYTYNNITNFNEVIIFYLILSSLFIIPILSYKDIIYE